MQIIIIVKTNIHVAYNFILLAITPYCYNYSVNAAIVYHDLSNAFA